MISLESRPENQACTNPKNCDVVATDDNILPLIKHHQLKLLSLTDNRHLKQATSDVLTRREMKKSHSGCRDDRARPISNESGNDCKDKS